MTRRGLLMAAGAVAMVLTVTPVRPAAQDAPPEYGPAKGTLVIVGGGATEGTGIVEKFIQLAGGNDAKFVIVPTACARMPR
jgi:cyanophycinase